MSYGDWRTAFEALSRLAENERLAVIIDEFTYLLEAEPAVSAYLQHAWDHMLSKSNLFLVISGSHLGMMHRQVLSYQAPLYGRPQRTCFYSRFIWRHPILFHELCCR
jgi:AAA+ ATPase superfamily predicted ATPase